MSRSFPANTQIQRFLEESYNRERDARLSWYTRNSRGADTKGSKQLEVFKKKIEAGAPRPTETLLALRHVKPKNYHKQKMNHEDHLVKLAGEKPDALLVEMRPVTSLTRGKLYDGFTKEGKGRYQYLLDRYQNIPEDKYSFPLCSSWEYGWRLGDVIKQEDIKKPAHGRTKIVADTFYTRTGIPAMRCSATY